MVSAGPRKGRLLGTACVLITAGILIAGLWPLNFKPVNKVEWIGNGNGIGFYGQGMVVSRQPLEFTTIDPENGSITIELMVRPNRESNHTVTSILTLYDYNFEQFVIGHWRTHLAVRVPSSAAGNHKRYREIGVSNVLTKDVTHLITLVSEKEATDIYIDGKLKAHLPNFSLVTDEFGLKGRLLLGNSPEGIHSWNGIFFGLAIYDRTVPGMEVRDHYLEWKKRGQQRPVVTTESTSRKRERGVSREDAKDSKGFLNTGSALKRSYQGRLSGSSMPIALYLFDDRDGELVRDRSGSGNDLLIPKTFKPLRRTVLGMPDNNFFFKRSNLKDIAINMAGFIPFGFFLSAWLRFAKNPTARRVYGISLFLGFCLSLVIELTQGYFPTRDSSLMDVLSNTMGTAAGILLLKYALPILRNAKSGPMILP